jgi:uncharacterized protein (TIGR02246 family)
MMRYSFGTVAFALLMVVCAPPCGAQESGAKAVDAAWIKAMKANDIDAVMRCYAPDAVAWLPGTSEARGEKAIRSAYEGLLAPNTVKDVALSDTKYKTAGNVSVSWGKFSLMLVPKSGGNPAVMTGRFTVLAERRRDGRWVYVVDHASAEPAGTEGSKQ